PLNSPFSFNSPFPLNSNILLQLPISHNLNHLNHMVLNRLTYLNPKMRGLLTYKKSKGGRCSTKTTTNAGGSQLLKWTGIQNKNLTKAWVHVSEDIIKRNNQQLDFFGSRFWMHFMNFVKRMVNGLNV
ncbi:hypothetical protein GIB67_007011, partial [Kingdonia uniflora]